jgi:hypothetical protein
MPQVTAMVGERLTADDLCDIERVNRELDSAIALIQKNVYSIQIGQRITLFCAVVVQCDTDFAADQLDKFLKKQGIGHVQRELTPEGSLIHTT